MYHGSNLDLWLNGVSKVDEKKMEFASMTECSKFWLDVLNLYIYIYIYILGGERYKRRVKCIGQSLGTKLVIALRYNLTQHFFIGGEFWQIYHWMTSFSYILHACKIFKKNGLNRFCHTQPIFNLTTIMSFWIRFEILVQLLKYFELESRIVIVMICWNQLSNC